MEAIFTKAPFIGINSFNLIEQAPGGTTITFTKAAAPTTDVTDLVWLTNRIGTQKP